MQVRDIAPGVSIPVFAADLFFCVPRILEAILVITG